MIGTFVFSALWHRVSLKFLVWMIFTLAGFALETLTTRKYPQLDFAKRRFKSPVEPSPLQTEQTPSFIARAYSAMITPGRYTAGRHTHTRSEEEYTHLGPLIAGVICNGIFCLFTACVGFGFGPWGLISLGKYLWAKPLQFFGNLAYLVFLATFWVTYLIHLDACEIVRKLSPKNKRKNSIQKLATSPPVSHRPRPKRIQTADAHTRDAHSRCVHTRDAHTTDAQTTDAYTSDAHISDALTLDAHSVGMKARKNCSCEDCICTHCLAARPLPPKRSF